eukprot:g338.t1
MKQAGSSLASSLLADDENANEATPSPSVRNDPKDGTKGISGNPTNPIAGAAYAPLEVDDELPFAAAEAGNDASSTPFSHGTSSFNEGVFNMTNTIVGAGIIGLPYALREAGCWAGIAALVTMAALTDFSLRMLMRTAIQQRVTTYEALVQAALGRSGFTIVCIARFLFSGGAMLAYLLILGDTVTSVIASSASDNTAVNSIDSDALRRYAILGASLLLVLPLCLLRDITHLSKTSLLSIMTVGVMEMVVLAQLPNAAKFFNSSCAVGIDDGTCTHTFAVGGERGNPSVLEPAGFFPALAIFAFAFTCHDSSFIIISSFQKPTYQQWCRTTHISIAIATALCLLMALPGYLTFRAKTDPNLLNNYPNDDSVMTFVRALYALTMVLTYPMCFNVCRSVLNVVFYGTAAESQITMPLRRHLLLTLPLFFVALFLALIVKELGLVLELTGAVGATAVAFVLPAVSLLRLSSSASTGMVLPGSRAERRRAWALMIFGTIMGLTAAAQAIAKAGATN